VKQRRKEEAVKLGIFVLIAVMTLFAALAIPVLLSAQGQQNGKHFQHYNVTDVGTLGGTFSFATGVNSAGIVGGQATLPGDTAAHPFRWQDGAIADLGTFGGTNGESSWINQRGQQVGGAYLPGDTARHAFLWTDGVMADLGTLGGTNSFGVGINSQGQVAGFSDLAGDVASHAFLWINGVMTDLGTLPGGANSQAINIDDRDRAVGESDITTIPDPSLGFPPFHATLWVNGVPNDLGTLGGKLSVAIQGNNQGRVVGASDLSGDTESHGFLWENGVMQDLGTFPGDPDSSADSINNRGQIVGNSGTFIQALRAVIWQNGVIKDLNTLIPAGSGLQLLEGLAIDPVGHIAGYALVTAGPHTGEVHGFLLTPAGFASVAAEATDTVHPSATPNIMLPENVRRMLQGRIARWHGVLPPK
jgi:probable HAF family extracellular repeat protein